MRQVTRRDFQKAALALGLTTGIGGVRLSAANDRVPERAAPAGGFRGPFCFFSKHLPDLAWGELGRTVKEIGFDGVDLTVRPEGHVLPERVATDLPRALEAIRAAGAEVPMITTALLSAEDPAATPTFDAASKGGVRLLKPGYYKYELKHVTRELEDAGRQLSSLADLGRRYGIVVGYHTHAGYIGGPTLDFLPEIEKLDPDVVGVYFDVRHAVIEGGGIGWQLAAALSMPRLRMIAVKDCVWTKDEEGRWRDGHCPLGQGMVDWPAFCRMLAHADYQGPISLHFEYEVGGATPASRRDGMIEAARRDLAFVKTQMEEAYRG
ncbi:MAG: sugar phosphate isomerase/epimerase family protein [Vicinamibacteraceae bacterium]